MNLSKRYVEVILPVPVDGSFTYSINSDENIEIGQRVVVQFGSRKLYTAIVIDVHNNEPNLYKAKDVIAVLDEQTLVNKKQIKFWKWISEYYMSRLGDVMNVALPSSLKLASESKIIIHPDFDGDLDFLNDEENTVLSNLTLKEELTINDVISILDNGSILFGD
mgnify:FL=1